MDREFPKGRIREDDDGALKVRMTVDPDVQRLILEFETQTKWVGFDAESAKNFLNTFAKNVAKLTGAPVQISFCQDGDSDDD